MTLIHSPDMPTPEQEVQEGRNKRTIMLLAGGAVSLMLPLLGVVYIKMTHGYSPRAIAGARAGAFSPGKFRRRVGK